MATIRSVRDAKVQGKRVVLRVDFNVPLQNGKVVDDTRIKAALPTIHLLLVRGAKEIILLSHLGRPEGKHDLAFDLAPITERLHSLINAPEIKMYENLRFDAGEEANSPAFAKKLADLGDIFVNDAFAASHRAHASIVGIAKLLPAYAGLLIEEEVKRLSRALIPPRESIAIIGGAKYETKAPLINKLSSIYNKVFIGGAIANEFTPHQKNVFLPVDGVEDATHVADIGPKTQIEWASDIGKADFVLWNGPVGMYDHGFNAGTDAIAAAIAGGKATAVIGGGDTIAAIQKFSFDSTKIFISTGGGAMLEFLVEGTLPGIEVLKS